MSASPISGHHNLLIHGKRVPTAAGRYFDTVNPATEQVIAKVAEADSVDVDAAVRSSRAAFEGEWGNMRAADRGALMLKLADAIRDSQEELVELESLDAGKPVSAIRRQDLPAWSEPSFLGIFRS
jgi:aldehyde dehydrogenase (NAD+)